MTQELNEKLSKVLHEFKIDEKITAIEEMKNGNINVTYRVFTDGNDGLGKSYIIQNLNTYVFKNPELVMKNIDIVTSHIREVNKKETLHFRHTKKGKNYYKDGKNFWRMYTFVEGTAFADSFSPQIIKEAGKAFGKFQRRLADVDIKSLGETIPDFHNTRKRYEKFLKTIERDEFKRVINIKNAIEYLKNISSDCLIVSDLMKKKKLPIRVTHNDTKVSNALLNKFTFEPICVIDLDTVMPGTIVYDFGDAVRFISNPRGEEETDLAKVSFDFNSFTYFADGFISEVNKSLTKEELAAMADGVIAMTFELAIRFLDDYLDGDKYFKPRYPKHNMMRGLNQLQLLKSMLCRYNDMKEYIKKISE